MKEWVLVEHAGLRNEHVVREFDSFDDAWTAQYELYGDLEREELGVDIMLRLSDGELTTEY